VEAGDLSHRCETGKAEKLEDVVDKTIEVVTIAKDLTEVNPALGPLTAIMATLITALGNIRVRYKLCLPITT
jgi:hypothetical protein